MKTFHHKKKSSLSFLAFWQALAITLYCSLVGVLFWQGNNLFGPPFTFLGPTLFLVLFIVSAVICALLALGHPFILFWEKKQTKEALRLIAYTAAWLFFFFLLILITLIIF